MPSVGKERPPEGCPPGEGWAFIPTVSRDDAEGLLLEEEGHSDLISFQPTDSDLPSFLEDCNRVGQRACALHPWRGHVASLGREGRVWDPSPGPQGHRCLCFLQAKLPRGIHQVRPHLQHIDNVPLLVPLFTDCTPESERWATVPRASPGLLRGCWLPVQGAEEPGLEGAGESGGLQPWVCPF